MHDLQTRSDGTSPCPRCDGEQEHALVEHVDDVFGAPVWRTILRSARCARCGWWTKRPVDKVTRERFPRTRGVLPRIVVTWVLGLAIVPGVLAYMLWLRDLRHGYAEHPQIGDHWTIELARWPGTGEVFAKAGAYGRAEVRWVTDHVELAACNTTSDDTRLVEQRCWTYDIPLPPIDRAEVVARYEDGSIDMIRRRNDTFTTWFQLLGAWCGALALWSLLGRRFLRGAVQWTDTASIAPSG